MGSYVEERPDRNCRAPGRVELLTRTRAPSSSPASLPNFHFGIQSVRR